jgi:hypothetical protein
MVTAAAMLTDDELVAISKGETVAVTVDNRQPMPFQVTTTFDGSKVEFKFGPRP